MCFGGGAPSKDNTAQKLAMQEAHNVRLQEQYRQDQIRRGMASIDNTFDGARAITGYDKTRDKFGLENAFEFGSKVGQGTINKQYLPEGFDYTKKGGQYNIVGPDGKVYASAGSPEELARMSFKYTVKDPIYGERTGGFDQGFYDKFRQNFMDYYNPQLLQKFGDARDQLTYALARAGTLNSSLAADKAARLDAEYDVQRAGIVNQATGQENELKSRINSERSALVSQLNATGDADATANNASRVGLNLGQMQPNVSPLGDIFAGFASGIGQYLQGANNAAVYSAGYSPRSNPSRTVT